MTEVSAVQPMIHKFYLNGEYIVLDVNSGCVHLPDQLTYELLDTYDGTNPDEARAALGDRYPAAEIEEAIGEVDELIADGLLFATMDPAFTVALEERPIVKALCLNIAHDCNLRCRYCFAGQGGYGKWRELMSFDTARRAVDFLIAHSGPRKHCEIDFFGGEPLMNYHVVQQTIDYIRAQEKKHDKIFKLTLTTNGMLLDERKVQYFNEQHVSLVLSLDGREEVHDEVRPGVRGEGTYQPIRDHLAYAVQHCNGEEYYVRGTYTAKNLDFTTDVLDMVDQGFNELSMEPVVSEDDAFAITEEHLPQIFAEYEKLAQAYLDRQREGRPFQFFHFNMDLYRGPCLQKRLRGCGAGHEYMAVVPNGDIYPCHQFVGRDGYVIGNVKTGLFDMDTPRAFRENHVLKKPTCQGCWAKFFCSGGCHANNETFAGDIHEPYKVSCEIQKKRIECAMMIQAKMADIETERAQAANSVSARA